MLGGPFLEERSYKRSCGRIWVGTWNDRRNNVYPKAFGAPKGGQFHILWLEELLKKINRNEKNNFTNMEKRTVWRRYLQLRRRGPDNNRDFRDWGRKVARVRKRKPLGWVSGADQEVGLTLPRNGTFSRSGQMGGGGQGRDVVEGSSRPRVHVRTP